MFDEFELSTLGDEVPLNGRETELCEEPNAAGDGGPTLANEVFVTGCGDWDKKLDTGLGPTGVIEGFHVLVPPLQQNKIFILFPCFVGCILIYIITIVD